MTALGGPPLAVAAVVVLGALATFTLGVEPAIAARVGEQLMLAPPAVARILSAELGASMVAALATLLWYRHLGLRTVAVAASLLFIAANLWSEAWPTYGSLVAARGAAGLAGGTLLIVVLAAAARCRNPGRVYAAWVVGQTLSASAGLYALPAVFGHFGLAGVYGLLGLATLLALPLIPGLAAYPDRTPAEDVGHVPRHAVAAGSALGVLFLFYASVGGIWAFAADRGGEAGFGAIQVATALALANAIGMSGAMLAAAIAGRGWTVHCLLIGHAVLAGALLMFATAQQVWAYTLAVVLLQFAWSFAAPFLLAQVAACGSAAPMMSLANVVLGAGLTAGPLLAGAMLERPGRFGPAVGAALALLAAGAMLLIFGPRPRTAGAPARGPQRDVAS